MCNFCEREEEVVHLRRVYLPDDTCRSELACDNCRSEMNLEVVPQQSEERPESASASHLARENADAKP